MVLHARSFLSIAENYPEGGCQTPIFVGIISLWPHAYLLFLVQSFRVGQNLLNIQALSQSSSGLPAQGLCLIDGTTPVAGSGKLFQGALWVFWLMVCWSTVWNAPRMHVVTYNLPT